MWLILFLVLFFSQMCANLIKRWIRYDIAMCMIIQRPRIGHIHTTLQLENRRSPNWWMHSEQAVIWVLAIGYAARSNSGTANWWKNCSWWHSGGWNGMYWGSFAMSFCAEGFASVHCKEESESGPFFFQEREKHFQRVSASCISIIPKKQKYVTS